MMARELRTNRLSHNSLPRGFGMRTKLFAAAVALMASMVSVQAADAPAKGTVDAKSATALAFGPKGLLFIGDSAGAMIYAVQTGDTKMAGDKPVNFERIDSKVASLLGSTEKEV